MRRWWLAAGEYQQARSHYQQALEAAAQQVEHVAAPELLQACQAGLARCTLHMGDVRSGRQLALAVASPTLWRECALILEARGQQQVRRGSSQAGARR